MNLPEFLTDLSIHYNALIRNAASDIGLTVSQAFHLISIPYEGISMSALSNKLGLDTSTLTRNIQKLEKLGLVKKTREAYDKRVQKILLTSAGFQSVEIIETKLRDVSNLLLENMEIEAQEMLIDVLERLVWSMDCLREI